LDTAQLMRQATLSDCTKLKEIIDLSFSRFFRFFASQSLDSAEGKVFVCERQGAVAGFAKLIDFNVDGSKYGCILWLAVHPEHRRKGIAADLVKVAAENLNQNGAGAVFASVQRRNKASLVTFGKDGFKRMGFLDLWGLFSFRVFSFYREIWYAPGEVVLMLK
jgi:N-acetylglutamate synthase-like GNAT family acetyltransferase